jgi:hypothetical protein
MSALELARRAVSERMTHAPRYPVGTPVATLNGCEGVIVENTGGDVYCDVMFSVGEYELRGVTLFENIIPLDRPQIDTVHPVRQLSLFGD